MEFKKKKKNMCQKIFSNGMLRFHFELVSFVIWWFWSRFDKSRQSNKAGAVESNIDIVDVINFVFFFVAIPKADGIGNI